MKEKVVVVVNARGIHIRPSSLISLALRGYEGKASVIVGDGRPQEITASPMSIMSLELHKGAVVTLRVEGKDEASKLAELAELFGRDYNYQ